MHVRLAMLPAAPNVAWIGKPDGSRCNMEWGMDQWELIGKHNAICE